MPESVPLNVLYVEDSEDDATLVTAVLKRAHYQVQAHRVVTAAAMQAELQNSRWDVVIADYSLPQFGAPRALAILRESDLDIPFIVISGAIVEEQAVTVLRAGAHDFITKGNLARLGPAIEREMRDAANRRQHHAAQELLLEQEASFRLLFEGNPLPMWVYDAETLAFLEVNEAAISHYGYSHAQFLRMSIAEIRAPQEIPPLLADVEEQCQAVQPSSGQQRHSKRDGQLIDVEIVAHTLALRGRPAVLIVANDITNSKQARQKLSELAAIVESSSDAIIGCASTGDITSWNSGAQALLGYSAEEVTGRSLSAIYTPEQMAALVRGFERLKAGERIEPLDQVWTHKDGHQTQVAASLSLIKAADGQIIGNAIIARDITESKRAEATLNRQSAESTRKRQTGVTRELAAIVLLGFVAYVTADYINPFRGFSTWANGADVYLVDDLLLALAVVMAALLVFSYRRWTEARAEIGGRNQVEAALRTLHGDLEIRIHERTSDLVRANADLRAEIAERQQAEEAVAASAAELRALFAAMTDVVLVIDGQGRYLQIAPTNPGLLVKPPAEFLGRNLHELLPAPEADRILEAIRQALETRVPVHVEYSLSIDGAQVWFDGSAATMGADRVFWISRDITERKHRERELEAIAAVSAALRAASSRAQMLPIILDQMMVLLGAGAAALAMRDAATDEIVVELGQGEMASLTGQHVPAGAGISGQVVVTGQPYTTADISADPSIYQVSWTDQARAAACVPLITRVKVLGVLWAGRPAAFSEGEIRVLSAIADIVASAIQRMALYEDIEQRLLRLAALREIDGAIINSLDLRLTLATILSHVTVQLGVHAADVLLLNRGEQVLEYEVGRGFLSKGIQSSRLRLGEGHAGLAALQRRPVVVSNIQAEANPFQRAALLADEGFVAYVCVPLVAKGQVVGTLEVFHRAPLAPNADWLNFFETLAGQAAIAVADAWLFADLQRANMDMAQAYDTTLEGWSAALDLRDKETEGHSQRVTQMTLKLARVMEVSALELEHIRRGALLHDIGKMGIPDGILLKPGPLTDDEWFIMRQHPTLAYQLLSPIAYLRPALDIPYCHHEKWDGTGYPRGLKGAAIPPGARIFAVVDVWDALRSDRPYRKHWPIEQVLGHIRDQAGKHFDPDVVAAFLDMQAHSVCPDGE